MKKIFENFGIGIDITEVDRFRRKKFQKNKNFYNKILYKSEIDYCLRFKDPYTHFAGKFATKEAVRKSINQKIKLTDVITSHDKSKPKVRIKNKPQYNFQVSISHEKNMAVGIVICELTK